MIGGKKSVKSKRKSMKSNNLVKRKPIRKSRKSKPKRKSRKSKPKRKSRKSKPKRKSRKSSNYLLFNKLKNNNYQKGLFENDRHDIDKIDLHTLDQLGGAHLEESFKETIKGNESIYDDASHNLNVINRTDKASERNYYDLLEKMLDLIIKNHKGFIENPDFMTISSDMYYNWAGGFEKFNSIITPEGKTSKHKFGDKTMVDNKINVIHHSINNNINTKTLSEQIKGLHEESNEELYRFLLSKLNGDILEKIKTKVYNIL
jgi:hypothetical protein